MASSSEPNETNGYLAAHVNRLMASLRHWTGRNLLDVDSPAAEQARQLFHAPFVVLSHNQTSDPILNYANLVGLRLFELSWDELICLPSRRTAEPVHQDERARLLESGDAPGIYRQLPGHSGVQNRAALFNRAGDGVEFVR